MKNEKSYLIVANGNLDELEVLKRLVQSADVVVCVDGGARHLYRLGLMPDLLMGDLDSIDGRHRDYFLRNKVKLIQHSPKKDATDTELAIDWAIENGATEITLTAVTGTRLDHTLANIFLLKSIRKRGVDARIVDDHNEIYLFNCEHRDPGKSEIKDGYQVRKKKKYIEQSYGKGKDKGRSISIEGNPGGLLSIIPVSERVEEITLEGLEYPLVNAVLPFGSSRGISNVFVKKTARIFMKKGTVLITKSRD